MEIFEKLNNMVKKISKYLGGKVEILLLITVLILFASIEKAFVFSNIVDSDSVENIIWAQATIDSGELVSKSFIYPYFIPFGGNVLMIPFIKLFGFGLFANRMGMTFFLLLTIILLIRLGRAFGLNYKCLMLFMICSLLMFRSMHGMNLLRHILYYQIGLACFLGVMTIVISFCKTNSIEVVNYIELIIWGYIAGINGAPTLALSIIPILLGVIICIILKKKIEDSALIKIAGAIFIGALLGYVSYGLFTKGGMTHNYLDATGAYQFLDLDEWISNIQKLPRDWILSFMVLPPKGINFFSLNSIEIALELILSGIVVILPIVYCFKNNSKIRDETAWLILIVSIIMIWAVCLLEYVFLRGSEVRLLGNAFFVTVVLFAIIVSTILFKRKRIVVLLCLCVIFMSTQLLFRNNNLDTNLIDHLKENNLEFGYADYWQANVNTVISEGNIKIRSMYITPEGEIWASWYGTDRKWFHRPECDKFFVIATDDDLELISMENQEALSFVESTFDIDDKHILVFNSENWDKIITGEFLPQ